MTPEREAYLENCSNREAWLRSAIRATQRDISYQKERMTNANDEWIVTGAECELWHEKQLLMTLRHELQRLKGMDRAVVPRQVRMVAYPASHGFGSGYECVAIGLCACGAPLREDECKYCQRCGKRVLWEKRVE